MVTIAIVATALPPDVDDDGSYRKMKLKSEHTYDASMLGTLLGALWAQSVTDNIR